MTEARTPNNFDALRLGAALTVLVSHSFQISYGNYQMEPVWRIGPHQATLGHIAVAVFFIVSGYLITGSYARRPDPARFVQARALRLLPGLAVCLTVLAALAGPLLTVLPLGEYAASPGPLWFVLVNLSLTGFETSLPGVFGGNPFPDVVNGSLWTLRYEAECYALVLLLGWTGTLNRWTVAAMLAVFFLASARWIGGSRTEFASLFFGGAAMYMWQPPLRRWMAGSACFVLILALLTRSFWLAAATAGAYLIIYAARALRPVRLPWQSDLSYGVYLWAFPVQQAVTMALGVYAAWWVNVALSLPPVLALAWLSWHYVEAPALALLTRNAHAR